MRGKSLIPAFACLFLTTACDENTPVGPSVSLNQEFTLAPGQTAAVQDTSLRVQFLRVSGDSRCPADVLCIQGGDALVHVRISNGGSSEYEFHTGDESRAVITHSGLNISLVNLQPYPFSSRTIPPDEYRAIMRVVRP